MRYSKLTVFLRAGRFLPLLTILILLQVNQSTSNILRIAEKQNDLKNSEYLASNEPGPARETHPTIVYNEDIVREDYDAFKSKKNERAQRKIKQNKIFFDILPQAPIVVGDDDDLIFNTKQLQVDIIPLMEDHSIDLEGRKLHRLRRNSEDDHVVKKRNPYIHYYDDHYTSSNHIQYQHDSRSYYPRRRQPVQGVLWNGIDRPVPTSAPLPKAISNRFGNDDEEDRVVWDRFRPVQTSPPLASMPASIFHDSNPANADFGFLNRRPQTTATDQTGRVTTQRPDTSTSTPPSIFHDSNPAHADVSFTIRRPSISQTTTSAPQQIAANAGGAAPQESPITACVWAIVNCCSNRDQNVRYSCFEDHGCSGSFFDLNPCGDFKDRVIEYVAGVIN